MHEYIFVGSSKESKWIANEICNELKKHDLSPRLWSDEFPPGTFTLEQLLKVSHEVQGAVFVFGNDDVILHRGSRISTTRDNVILEWGIFVSRLNNTKRCIVYCSHGVKPPTDLAGLTYVDGSDPLATTKLSKHLKNEFQCEVARFPGEIFIVSDTRLGLLQMADSLPDDWLLRGSYLGSEGARAWLSVSNDPIYKHNASQERFRTTILSRLEGMNVHFRSFVSFGPGDGSLDEDICMKLRRSETNLIYIPVDISEGLLIRVCATLKHKITIPVGLLADFEGHFDFVESKLKHYAKGPILYGLLGGTFGNVDTNEHKLLSGLIGSMSATDVLLFDAAIRKPDQLDIATEVSTLSPGKKNFYSHAASRLIKIKPDKIQANIENYITTDICDGPTAIKDTKVVVFNANYNGIQKPFAYVRRYTLSSLIAWLKEMFPVNVEAVEFPSEGLFDRTLLALRKRP